MKDVTTFFRIVRGILSKWKNTLYYNLPLGPKVYLVGTPVHCNVGDSAIVLASLKFLRECYPKAGCVKEMTVYDYKFFGRAVHRACKARGRVVGHGGGNMGDQYRTDEGFRRKIISAFVSNYPVIFPQTIHYSDSENGRAERDESIEIYNHPEVTIVAREETSFKMMHALYPRAKILLTPDIVLSTTAADYGVMPRERHGILWCMRNDVEKSMSEELETQLFDYIRTFRKAINKTDMMGPDPMVTKENRRELVRAKMQEFASSELVITDRLHGMIFAAITGTPCLVYSNYNHKVRGSYEWISYLPYIRLAETVSDAEANLPELLDMKECSYDNTPLQPHFEALRQELCKENK